MPPHFWFFVDYIWVRRMQVSILLKEKTLHSEEHKKIKKRKKAEDKVKQ